MERRDGGGGRALEGTRGRRALGWERIEMGGVGFGIDGILSIRFLLLR